MQTPMLEYTKHPLSDPFPPMASHDFEELVRSMRDRGYDNVHPITLFEGQILDGWNRWLSSKKAKVVPSFREFEGSKGDAKYFVYVENLARRHLTHKKRVSSGYERMASPARSVERCYDS